MVSALTENEKRYALSKVRIERARELVVESERLLNEESFKSANNRAYYAIEKSMKALLAIKGLDATTHNGVMKLINLHFIHQGDGSFSQDDYKMILRAVQIRNVSDYDDFYIASKQEAKEQVSNARSMLQKVEIYISKMMEKNDN